MIHDGEAGMNLYSPDGSMEYTWSIVIWENNSSAFDKKKKNAGTLSLNVAINFTWNDRIFITHILWCISVHDSSFLSDIMLYAGAVIFNKTKKGANAILYRLS